MALTPHVYSEYDPNQAERDKFVKKEENGSGKGGWIRPYYDGSIAIGYGFDLLTKVQWLEKARKWNTSSITSYLNKTNDALGLIDSQRITLS
jgi:hypothetical protein